MGCKSTGKKKQPKGARYEPQTVETAVDETLEESLEESLKNVDWSIEPLKTKRDSTGTLTMRFENDTFSDDSDNNFTAGFGFAWTSADVATLSPKNWFRNRVESEFSFLPTVSNPEYNKFVQLALNYEMYTATDISDSDPPPGDHPYSGLILFDYCVYSKGPLNTVPSSTRFQVRLLRESGALEVS